MASEAPKPFHLISATSRPLALSDFKTLLANDMDASYSDGQHSSLDNFGISKERSKVPKVRLDHVPYTDFFIIKTLNTMTRNRK